MIKKLILASVIVAVTTGTAFAQLPVGISPFNAPAKRSPTPEELAKQKAIDDAYKAATSKIPDRQTADPWSNVRTAPNPPPAAKKPTTAKQSAASKQTATSKAQQ